MNPVSLIDDQGHRYKTVKIGSLIWMAENWNGGVRVEAPRGNGSEAKQKSGEKWYYNNDEKSPYGGLYTRDAAVKSCLNAVKSCLNEWHLPTLEEWNNLFEFVELQENPEDCLCNLGMAPGGYWASGSFCNRGVEGVWWSSSGDNQSDSGKNAHVSTLMWGSNTCKNLIGIGILRCYSDCFACSVRYVSG